MVYKLYKMKFESGVHFGKKSLEDSEISFHADTLFSALCQEAVKCGGQRALDELVSLAEEDKIVLSDAFPYRKKEYYLPKPFIPIDPKGKKGDSGLKKQYKKLKYIPVSYFEEFVNGEFPEERLRDLEDLGTFSMKTAAAVRGREETEPYRIKNYYFHDGNGLYFLAGGESEKELELVEELLDGLTYSGIGGKRSSGAGKFQYFTAPIPEKLNNRLVCEKPARFMLLSVALPKAEELESAVNGAGYQLIKRSGFVASEAYGPEFMRKRDLYVFNSGSCFLQKFKGDIYDVSGGGNHPVYRYAKPMFMEVDYEK